MFALIDETRVLLADVITCHADQQDIIGILAWVRDDDPEVPVSRLVREVEGVSGLHCSGPEYRIQIALQLVLLLDRFDHVSLPLGLEGLFPRDRS